MFEFLVFIREMIIQFIFVGRRLGLEIYKLFIKFCKSDEKI